ncbi:hypothetical protein BGW42_002570 [Actinomortierella wolfii]|nr:hypothetical protein BGW42_002570 [Actinomortierella wolfii]
MNVQEFQFGDSVFKFPTAKDPTTGEEYIPHTSIIGCFPDAHCFLFDGVVVPFLTDPSGALTQPPPYNAAVSTTTTASIIQYGSHGQITRVVQGDMIQGIQSSEHLQQQLQKLSQQVGEIRDFSLVSLENQSKMLNQLALLQRKVEAILTQNYELHEYPIPRLFIILPVESSRWDPRNKYRTRFRLHFLCECGAHTKQLAHSHDRLPHHVHLALHEGYEVRKPGPFIENYGEYILGMLRMLKYGITVAGMIVPALSHLQVVKGLEGMEDNIVKISEQTILGIDQSISYLEARFQPQPVVDNTDEGEEKEGEGSNTRNNRVNESDRFTELRALEGADLRRLRSFLKINDTTKVLGNLYRITTSDGHVKWVCLSHYRSMYREYAMKALLDHIEANNSSAAYDEHLQKVIITLSSSTTAAQFFDILSKAPGVSELDVRLQWNFSGSDLARLRDTLRASMVHSLTIDGCQMARRTDVSLTSKRRNDRLLEIMAIDKIKYLCLKRFPDFLTKISSSAIKTMPIVHMLRTLHFIDIECVADDDYWRLGTLLAQCPNLVDVKIELQDSTRTTSDSRLSEFSEYLGGSGSGSVKSADSVVVITKASAAEAAAKGALIMSKLATLEQLESLTLYNMSLPIATVDGSQRLPTHLRMLDIAMRTDQLRQDALVNLLHANPGLTDFRLKSTSSRMFITDTLMDAIASCTRLERLECRISLWALNVRCKEPWRRLATLPSLKYVRFETTGSVDGVIQLAALVPTLDYFYLETMDGTSENLVVKAVIQDDDQDNDDSDMADEESNDGDKGDGNNSLSDAMGRMSISHSQQSSSVFSASSSPKKNRSLTIGDYRAVIDLSRIEELMPLLTATAWTSLCIHGMFSYEFDSELDFVAMDFSELQHLELKSMPVRTQDRFWKAYYRQLRQQAPTEGIVTEQRHQRQSSVQSTRKGSQPNSPTSTKKKPITLLHHLQSDCLPPTLVKGINLLVGLEELKLVLSDEFHRDDDRDVVYEHIKAKDEEEFDASTLLVKLIETIDLTTLRRLTISSTAERQMLTAEAVQALFDRLDGDVGAHLEIILREPNLSLEDEGRLSRLERQGKVKSIKVNGWIQRTLETSIANNDIKSGASQDKVLSGEVGSDAGSLFSV